MKTARMASMVLAAAAPAAAQSPVPVLGEDRAACVSGQGPAIRVAVIGLKDRAGELKLELYPANAQDFTRDDTLLLREGKTFRRIRVPTPASGPVAMCIRVPRPGRYALLFTHNRDNKNKFDAFNDGAGVVGAGRFGYSKPKFTQAVVDVGPGVTSVSITAQYLRGLSGFGPQKNPAG